MYLREITLPRLGETMESARLVRWLKKPGDALRRGEPMLELETDKTIVELPSLFAGEMVEQVALEGDDVAVDAVIARIRIHQQTSPGQAGTLTLTTSAETVAAMELQLPSPALEGEVKKVHRTTDPHGNIRATPVARARARSLGVELSTLVGTGRRARIELQDVARTTERLPPDGEKSLQFFTTPHGRLAFLDTLGRPTSGHRTTDAAAVLIHGFAADHTVWSALTSGLVRSGLRVLAPDLPSHGKTTIEGHCVDDLNKVLRSWVSGLNLPASVALHIVGHSLGGFVACALAEQLGPQAASLTLIAPIGMGREIASEFIDGMAAASTPREVSLLLRYLGPRGNSLSDSLLEAMAQELARARLKEIARDVVATSGLQRLDVLHKLGPMATRIPVRVIVGLLDQIVPPEQAHYLPPRAAAHFFSESGHMPMWDQPRELLDFVLHGVVNA